MDREEQKLEDLMVLEREIKEETADFIDEIKKEPLFEEYCEQMMPKIEEVIGPCLPSTLLLPTQNEYLSDFHTFQNISNDSNSSLQSFGQNIYQEQKLVPEFTVESHNKAPTVYRIPTLNKNSISKQRIAQFILNNDGAQKQTFDDNFPRINVEKKRTNSNFFYQWCSLCKHENHRENLLSVSCEEDKMIIMLGSVLRGEKSLANAQVIMLENWMVLNIFVCYSHFADAYNEICKVLLITNSSEIVSCSLNLIQMFIPTVNALIPHLTSLQFRTIFNNFTLRNKNLIEMDVPLRLDLEDCQIPNDFLQLEIKQENVKEEPMDEYFKQSEPLMKQCSTQVLHCPMPVQCQSNTDAVHDESFDRMQKRLRCSVCRQPKIRKILKFVSVEDDKLMIMIGCFLRFEYRIKEAQSFISQKKGLNVCHVHISEAFNNICKALNIKNPDEVPKCSADLMKTIMNIISVLCPKFISWQFHHKFKKFFTKYRRIIQNV